MNTVFRDINATLKKLLFKNLSDLVEENSIVFGQPDQVETSGNTQICMFLYRFQPNAHLRNVPPRYDNNKMIDPPLIMDLHYMVIPYAKDHETELMLLERIMGTLHDYAHLKGDLLEGDLANTGNSRVKIIQNIKGADETQPLLTSVMKDKFKLAAHYVITPVQIPSSKAAEAKLVAKRILEVKDLQELKKEEEAIKEAKKQARKEYMKKLWEVQKKAYEEKEEEDEDYDEDEDDDDEDEDSEDGDEDYSEDDSDDDEDSKDDDDDDGDEDYSEDDDDDSKDEDSKDDDDEDDDEDSKDDDDDDEDSKDDDDDEDDDDDSKDDDDEDDKDDDKDSKDDDDEDDSKDDDDEDDEDDEDSEDDGEDESNKSKNDSEKEEDK